MTLRQEREALVTTDPAGTVVVLTALNSEHESMRAFLDSPERHRHPAGTIFEVGKLPEQPGSIALAVIGVGNQTAAAITERAIAMFRPRAVLFVGIAGALRDDLDLGAVVVATKVYGYHGGTDETSGFRTRPQAWTADHELDQLAREVSRAGKWKSLRRDTHTSPLVHFTPIAAGEVVLNSRETPLAKQLHKSYADAAAIEMESAGMANAAHLNRVPCLTIRGISDKADGHKYTADDAERQEIAASNAAAFAIALAGSILTSGMPIEDRFISRSSTPPSEVSKKRILTIMATVVLLSIIVAAVVFIPDLKPWDDSGASDSHPDESSTSRLKPDTPLTAYTADGTLHVIYLDEFGNIHQADPEGTGWRMSNLTDTARAPRAATESPLVVYISPSGDTQILYIGTDYHLHGFSGSSDGWTHTDLTSTARAVPVGTSSGLAGGFTGQLRHAIYLGNDDQVHELRWDQPNGARDMLMTTTQSAAPSKAPKSPLHFATSGDRWSIYYLDGSGYVQQIGGDTSQWAPEDLTAATGAPAAAGNSPLSSFISPGIDHVWYVSVDRHVRELVSSPSGWTHNDLTSATGTLPAASDTSLAVFPQESTYDLAYIGNDSEIHVLTRHSEDPPFVQGVTNAQTRAPSPARGTSLAACIFGGRHYLHYVDAKGVLRQIEGDAAGWHLAR